jgi:hypothetical protein
LKLGFDFLVVEVLPFTKEPLIHVNFHHLTYMIT